MLPTIRFAPRASWQIAAAVWLIFGLHAPSTAHAQEKATDEASATTDDVVITDKARMHFKAGVNLLQDPEGAKYDEAYQQFKAAYEESPSWKILGNLGLAAMNLERYGEAITAFEDYLERGGESLSEQEIAQFNRDLETLRASVAYVTITARPGTNLTDVRSSNRGEDIRNYYAIPESGELTIGMRPGQHKLTAESEGQEIGTWSVTLESLASVQHSFESEERESHATSPPPDPAQAKKSRVPAYAALGVGAIGVGAGVAFLIVRGSHDKKAQDQYDDCLDSTACGSTEQTTIEGRDQKAATAGTISLISFGVGAAGLGTGLVLLLMGDDSGEKPLEAKVGSVKVSPYASASRWGISGTF